MYVTPFLSGLISSAVNHSYFVSINESIIRIKINKNETLIIKQYTNGDIDFGLSSYGVFRAIPKNVVYDFLFSIDEYGFRLYSGFNNFDNARV